MYLTDIRAIHIQEHINRLDAEGFALEDKIEELEGIEIEIDRDITRLRKLKKEVDNWDLGFDTAAILNLLLSKMDSYKMLLGKATLFLAFASQINGNAGFAESGDGWNLQTKDVIYLRPVDRDGLISGLAGKVIIAGTDTPIKGARVELRFWDGSQWQPAGIRSSQSDGSYTFGIKEWGSYNLIVRAEGYQERQYAFMAEEGELVGPERVELIPLIKTTPIPSTSPTATSKATPTTSPTAEPTLKPTPNPTPNQTPTAVPTMIPTPAPTVSPTPIWTPAASPAPTEIPGGIATPTVKWTAVPTAQPIAAD